ncbi:hypothetical protein L228DRAFT_54333 [Xylona heveae TC161]|uniref:U1-type domain-containing protein n=1 Tax=Xylona heveae (strain CBS 132557 / TC161) TaxID=1328760 RepID=A0A164Z9E2_XYLHT|nr:hypothetical protein L228DRAFT_54333 [Xylona heveae TC161]KZF18843.1 hypothetical protein L228DRAFT_54333 [Xylona heveae TC161]
MSEYWKSTPRYWCKHCKIYVRDTKFERQQHDATGRHQGNLNRFLRDLHKNNDRAEREKQRAKDEVERLNGIVSGTGATKPSGSKPETIGRRVPGPRQATVEDRKQQMAQLAAMGVSVPDDFRREMAMAGDWQVMSETPVARSAKEEDGAEKKSDVKNFGVHKRKRPGEEDVEDEEEAGTTTIRKKWGTTIKTYPGATEEDDDLDALLEKGKQAKAAKVNAEEETGDSEIKKEPVVKQDPDSPAAEAEAPVISDVPRIKKEESDADLGISNSVRDVGDASDPPIKSEDGAAPGAGVVFKKRTAKKIRQK